MHIKGMTIGGVPPFTERIDFKFDERVNVFIGPNASGKSTVLFLLETIPHFPLDTLRSDDLFIGDVSVEASDDWRMTEDENGEVIPYWNALPEVSISATRIALPRVEQMYKNENAMPEINDEREIDILLSGAANSLSKFDGPSVERIGMLLAEEGKQGGLELSELERAIRLSFRCAKSICNEMISGHTPFAIVADTDRTNPDIRPAMAVDTIDRVREGGHLEIHSLSSGLQSSLMWIRLMAIKMVEHYGYEDEWEKRPAILLIDEIENHLHPTWQRRVIPALLEHFPGLQIFATTHSPFVVAGLKAGQVHMLNRDANGAVTASTNAEDIVGWTSDEILRNLMGVDDPTDDATAAAARELRRLRDEGPRDTEDAEAARQARMQELRRLVDRDLLAGGPAAAQRELFEQQFAEALEKYQRSRDLGQDSG